MTGSPGRGPNRRALTALIGLLLLATGVRLAGIAKEPFWFDEVCSFDMSSGRLARLLEMSAGDSSPPLYMVGLAGWRCILGDSETALRGFSVAFSLAGLVGAFLLARDLGGGWRAGLIAAGLVAVNPVDIYFAQEARMYAHVAAALIFGSWFLWRWVTSVRAGRSRVVQAAWAFAYVGAATAAMYTHYLAALVVVVQGVFALTVFVRERQWRSAATLAAGAAVSTASFVPWLLFVLRTRDGLYYVDALRWMRPPAVWDATGRLLHELVWGAGSTWGRPGTVQAVLSAVAAGLLVAAIGWILAREGRRGRPPAQADPRLRHRALAYSGSLVAGPAVLAFLLSHTYHPLFYRPRFAMLVVLPFLVLVAIAVDALPAKSLGTAALAVLGGLMIAGSVLQFQAHTKTGMREFAAAWQRLGPPAFVVFVPGYTARVASYYLRQPIRSASRREIEGALSGGRTVEIWVCTDRNPVVGLTDSQKQMLAWLRGLGTEAPLGKLDAYDVVRIVATPRSAPASGI